ncbi:MAG: PPE-repeat protein [Zhongshania aliphaticivorans]|jgi:PPE-repeat protein|uniref:hypothetical protein n=1 Tax=Zhongshania aliphaticivorans TaxID=1470434 RepID=UPI0039E43104
MDANQKPSIVILEKIMLKKHLPYSTLAALALITSTLASAQNLVPLEIITNSVMSLSGAAGLSSLAIGENSLETNNDQQMRDTIGPILSITEENGLNSSPLFNILPNNPFVLVSSAVLDGPENAIIVSDLLQGNLIINGVLSGLPGGNTIRSAYRENMASAVPKTPAEGLINSQL